MKKILAVVLGAVLAAGLALVPTPPAGAATAPSKQVITVRAATSSSQYAQLDLWVVRSNGTHAHIAGPWKAWIGSQGVGATREGLSRTPSGVYSLTQTFGNQADDGTKMPFFRAGVRDWWDENPASPTYNTHVVRSSSPGGDSENLYYAGYVYAHAVVINYNTSARTPGAGSGFFLHVTDHRPTAGCVATASAQITYIMRWLNPPAHPVISIGVGAAAWKILG